jgi:hypothetical protein
VEKYGTAGQATDGSIVRRMRFACWITKAADTHSEYVIFIAFSWAAWLRERASVLRYTYITFLFFNRPIAPRKTLWSATRYGCFALRTQLPASGGFIVVVPVCSGEENYWCRRRESNPVYSLTGHLMDVAGPLRRETTFKALRHVAHCWYR